MKSPEYLEEWINDNVGVSPVIGVILMVAVTVILAAVIGATALGMGDRIGEAPPQAQFEADEEVTSIDSNTGTLENARLVTLTHTGGDDIDQEKIDVTVNGEPAYGLTFEDGRIVEDFYDDGSPHYGAIIKPFGTAGESIKTGDQFILLFSGSVINEWIENTGSSIGYLEMPYNSDHFLYSRNHGQFKNKNNYHNDLKLEPGDTIRIIWGSGDQSQILFEHEVH